MIRSIFHIRSLGQTGFRFGYAETIVYIDPYLSNSVQEEEADDLARLITAPISPTDVTDADWILITHEHRDHCDLETLLPISRASTKCCFMGPPNVVDMLENAGVSTERISTAECGVAKKLDLEWEIHPVPSAHPNVDRDAHGKCRWLGYVIKVGQRCIYHAGDTSVNEEVINAVKSVGKIDIAFLPVNERNYYRERRGIIGNMSVREAFQFAEEIGADALVPTHWDMFEVNSAFREEIELLYDKISPQFELLLDPDTIK